MLDYKLLEAFALVVLEGGFDKAARKLHLTQSAVSQRVRLLEDQWGQLLLRRTTPPEPTDSGRPLLIHYRQVRQLESDLQHRRQATRQPKFASLAVAVNADSLSTWFYPAVKELLIGERIVLDIQVDDQDRTHELMQEGKVWGCISTRSQPLQGCRAIRLGRERYGIFATDRFAGSWFGDGLTKEAFARAPMARYNRKDDLNRRMLELLLAEPPDNPPTFYIPSTEVYGRFVAEGRCWGILPEQQSRRLEEEGRVINLSPDHWLEIDLFWHSWNLKSELMDRFSRQLVTAAGRILLQETDELSIGYKA